MKEENELTYYYTNNIKILIVSPNFNKISRVRNVPIPSVRQHRFNFLKTSITGVFPKLTCQIFSRTSESAFLVEDAIEHLSK